MFDATVHRERRLSLAARVGRPIVLLGNGRRARNLPMTELAFRQDSSFLYFTGCVLPDAAALIRPDGHTTVWLPAPDPADELWEGPAPSLASLRLALGVDAVRDAAELDADLRALEPFATLAVADEAKNAWMTSIRGGELRFGKLSGDDDLIDAVIQLRRPKSAAEIDELRRAASVTRAAHVALMRATRPGESERTLAALFRAVATRYGFDLGYHIILSQRGEILHNHEHADPLQAGRLLLLDAGAETPSGYTADVTRTWPVDGRFDGRQRAAYEAVLAAQKASINLVRAGRPYRDVHFASCQVIAQFLRDERLTHLSADDCVAEGAHALFFPHGVGHHLGMDVHDLENFGDRPSYPPGVPRDPRFGTRYLRLNLPLEAGWVVTIEPGFYVVPAILRDADLRSRHAAHVDFERANSWIGFGGIRIEDNIHVLPEGSENLTAEIPREIAEIEAIVGTGPEWSSLLS
jgi:Xaa-Pro aminopeptidase